MKKLKFNYDHNPRKKGEVVEFTTREELRIADFYINAGLAHEVCEDCKKGKKGCVDCGDTAVIDEPKEEVVEASEIKEPVKRTRKSSKK